MAESEITSARPTDPEAYTFVDVVLAPLVWMSDRLARYGLYMALLTAWVSMVGSLYFSEVRDLDPCVLCWYQRILLYPLALIVPVGILRRDDRIHAYIFSFTLLCIPTAIYHYLIQKTSWFSDATVCRHGVPCSAMYIDWFGFVTIPLLALIASIIISLATSAWMRGEYRHAAAEGRRPWLPVLGVVAVVLVFYAAVYRLVG